MFLCEWVVVPPTTFAAHEPTKKAVRGWVCHTQGRAPTCAESATYKNPNADERQDVRGPTADDPAATCLPAVSLGLRGRAGRPVRSAALRKELGNPVSGLERSRCVRPSCCEHVGKGGVSQWPAQGVGCLLVEVRKRGLDTGADVILRGGHSEHRLVREQMVDVQESHVRSGASEAPSAVPAVGDRHQFAVLQLSEAAPDDLGLVAIRCDVAAALSDPRRSYDSHVRVCTARLI